MNKIACGEVGLPVSCMPYRVTFETVKGERHRPSHKAGHRQVAILSREQRRQARARSRVRVISWSKSRDVGRLQAVLDTLRIAYQHNGLIRQGRVPSGALAFAAKT
jgi:hypothetical protein